MPIAGPVLPGPADLTDLLAPALTDKPNETALVSPSRTWTWQELEQEIDTLAAQLAAMGLQRGDRIASLMPNRGELLLHYLACLRAGLVVTPLNYRYTAPEIDYALEVSGASLLLAHAERADDIHASTLANDLPFGIIAFGGPLDGAGRLEDLIAGEKPQAVLPDSDVDAPALVFFTSGSTGKPKGVTHSLFSFGSVVASWSRAMEVTGEDVVFPGGSIAHVGSLVTSFAAFAATSRVIIAHSVDGDEVLSLLRDNRPSVFLSLPSALIDLERDHGATREDFASVRLCMSGGDKFPASVEEEFTERTGLVINETYGLTEATGCLFNLSQPLAKMGSTGTVTPGFTLCIRDDSGQEVPADVDGKLWISGAPVTIGYWNNDKATDAAFADGWFDSGDVMRVDADGYFWFRGRKKQIIVHDGSNIAPQDIEEVVMAHPAVDQAGVVGVHDDVHGENVWAYVTLVDGAATPRTQDIIRFAREKVGYKAPEMVLVLDTMPVNPSGKVDRLALKKLAAERLAAEHTHT